MRDSLTEKVTFKHRLKGGNKVGPIKDYNGLSQAAIAWTAKEGRGSKYSGQDWWLIRNGKGETVNLNPGKVNIVDRFLNAPSHMNPACLLLLYAIL